MIKRYTRKEMGRVWSGENRFAQMLNVEKAVAFVQGSKKIIPKKAAQAIQSKAHFSVSGIQKLEEKTRHDVSAFVQNVSSYVGKPWGAYVHYGLTSSDVLDTALSLQIKEGALIIQKELQQLKKVLKTLIQKNKRTLCTGRTHGMHAEPTTFAFKLLGFLSELMRAENSFKQAVSEGALGMISGPVGNYSSSSSDLEKAVCRRLKLVPEFISTQVLPRDRHARIIFSISLILTALERLAVELRHLQRTEVSEVFEGFSKNQQGSSSMPHKKNPISAENITGLSRLLRSYLQSSMENIVLWHERDISHSSVERVIFPDAFILCDYALSRMTQLLKNLKVNTKRMKENLLSSGGEVFSSQILLTLIQKGVDRQEAYSWVQKAAHEGSSFEEGLKKTSAGKYIGSKLWKEIFSGQAVLDKLEKTFSHKY